MQSAFLKVFGVFRSGFGHLHFSTPTSANIFRNLALCTRVIIKTDSKGNLNARALKVCDG